MDLPTPGLAGDQQHRAGHQPAAEHPVELGDAGGDRPGAGELDLGDRPGRGGDRAGATRRAAPAAGAPTSWMLPQAWHSGQRPTHLAEA